MNEAQFEKVQHNCNSFYKLYKFCSVKEILLNSGQNYHTYKEMGVSKSFKDIRKYIEISSLGNNTEIWKAKSIDIENVKSQYMNFFLFVDNRYQSLRYLTILWRNGCICVQLVES